jgi:DNA invertase Pin-like site-specific DNA recombinase/predicted Zn-ribbon and HTH transcriptional regulator
MARKSRKHLYDIDAAPVQEEILYNAGGYLRLSADDTKKRGDSLDTQRNIIENYIAASTDIRLSEIYIDNNRTGTSFDRPGFQKMLMDAENGKINCIIVKDLTRFGRNAIDSGYYLEKHLPSMGVRFIAITDGFDSVDDDGGILMPLKMIINETYALDISRKCRDVQRQSIRDGRFVGRIAPYGYMKAPDDCHKLIVNEETAHIVRQIFKWAYEGIVSNEIARRLNDQKVISPNHYNFTKGHNISEKLLGSVYWKPTMIKKMLSNRVYIGDMVQGKTRTVNHVQNDIDPSEWICVEGTHEPLVSHDVFDFIRELNQKTYEQNLMVRDFGSYSANVFIGKVTCAKCGYKMKRKRQNKDGAYWFRCESQWKYSKDACTVVSVREADLKSEVMTLLQIQSNVINGKLINAYNISSKTEKDKLNAELREINKGLDKDGYMLRSLYESMVNGIITDEEFAYMKADYESKIADLSARADDIRNISLEAEKSKVEFHNIAEAVSAVLSDNALNSEIIEMLVENINVSPDKSFKIHLRYADEFKEVCA